MYFDRIGEVQPRTFVVGGRVATFGISETEPRRPRRRYNVRMNALSPDAKLIAEAIKDARRVLWGEYRDVFEHQGPIGANPVLADDKRFMHFCVRWGVSRTIRKGTHDRLRCWLRDSPAFADGIRDDTGQRLGQLEVELRAEFGARGGGSLTSVVSKVAAFLRPDRVVAWDKYARRGLNLVLGRSPGAAFKDYPAYLADFELVWNGPQGDLVREMTRRAPKESIEETPRFQRRVLDLYLLARGRAG